MEEFPSQSRKSREPREVQPVTLAPGRIRKQPAGRRLMETFFQGDLRETFSSMLWNTFFPNLRENFSDSMHDGVDFMFHGTEGSRRPRRGSGGGMYRNDSSVTRHNPDRALGNRQPERISKEDRVRQNTSVIELDSRAEAEEVLNSLALTLEQYDQVSLAEFYQLVRISPDHTDFGWGWEDLGNAKIGHSRGAYYLDLPPVIKLR